MNDEELPESEQMRDCAVIAAALIKHYRKDELLEDEARARLTMLAVTIYWDLVADLDSSKHPPEKNGGGNEYGKE